MMTQHANSLLARVQEYAKHADVTDPQEIHVCFGHYTHIFARRRDGSTVSLHSKTGSRDMAGGYLRADDDGIQLSLPVQLNSPFTIISLRRPKASLTMNEAVENVFGYVRNPDLVAETLLDFAVQRDPDAVGAVLFVGARVRLHVLQPDNKYMSYSFDSELGFVQDDSPHPCPKTCRFQLNALRKA